MRSQSQARSDGRGSRHRSAATLFSGGLLAVLLIGASATAAAGATTAATGTPTPIATAPDEARVDLETPSFSDPTAITNPLFPISELAQVIQLGVDAGETLRTEASLLPDTKTIEWNGQQVETLVQQYVAYLDGRILEVALDYYAQADDGSVWYFGEDVFNYEDGVVVNNDGTWLAGRDGPPGMIMPADPQVGDVYRPENIPGLVFEETTVKATGVTVDGPRGPVEGAVVVQEVLMDGSVEEKIFAPGYGEFQARTDEELITVAVAVPIDALPGRLPDELRTLTGGAADVFRQAPRGDWDQISSTTEEMNDAWAAYQAGDVPPLLDAQLTDALDALTEAVESRNSADVRQGAIDVAKATLDLQLQYRSRVRVDLARLEVWKRQLIVDTTARDQAAVAGDIATLQAIHGRLGPR